MWIEKWTEDIDFLSKTLVNGHKNLFFKKDKNEFFKDIDELKRDLGNLEYEDIVIRLSKIISSIGDAHTTLGFSVKYAMPITTYWFNDGIYIIDTDEDNKDTLYKKIDKIENFKIDDVMEKIKEIVPFENNQFFKEKSMKYLVIADILYGLFIIDNLEDVLISFSDGSEKLLRLKDIRNINLVNKKKPFYLENSTENIWYKVENSKIYIKYNSCKGNILEKIENIKTAIEENNIKSVDIDFRHNLGGDSRLFDPFIDYLKMKDMEIRVIIGRGTFSSALLNVFRLKFELNAKIIGEGTGGKPNCYGEVLRCTLPNSKFRLSYSTKYYKIIEDDTILTLEPDVEILESIDDWRDLK